MLSESIKISTGIQALNILFYIWGMYGMIQKLAVHLKYFAVVAFSLVFFKASSNTQNQFSYISVEKGLSQSWVMCTAQDSLGFMWFGTSDGLNKYDGYNFTIYTQHNGDTNSIISNHIQALEVDEKGDIWVGTNAGLCYYNYYSDRFIDKPEFTDNSTNSLTLYKGIIYAGTSDGIYLYDINSSKVLERAASSINSQLLNLRINVITTDKTGRIWIGTSEGLFIYNTETEELITDTIQNGNLSLNNKYIRALAIDEKNQAWIGTSEDGLYYFKDAAKGLKELKRKNFRNKSSDPTSINLGKIQAIHVDSKNNLLVGIENGGVDVINLDRIDEEPVKFSHQTSQSGRRNSLSNNSIYSIFEDSRKDIWIGTYGGGVNFLNIQGNNFNLITHEHNEPNSLANKIVNVVKKYEGKVWVGTEGGISIIDINENTYRHITSEADNPNSLKSNAIWSLFIDVNEHAWIGTWAGGLSRLDIARNRYEHYEFGTRSADGSGSDNIFAITSDVNDDIWIGSLGGGIKKFLINENRMLSYDLRTDTASSTLLDEIRHLYFNSRNELWFSTSISIGYIDVKTDEIFHYMPDELDKNAIIRNGAYVIFEDSYQTMWFGNDAGLIIFDRKEGDFKRYAASDKMSNSTVKAIQEDNHGNFWIGTNGGLVKLLNAIEQPLNPVFKTFDVNDGIQGNEFNRRASYKDEEGMMYFGGPNGLTWFHPDSINENRVSPNVVFTDFLIFNKSINLRDAHSPIDKHINLTNEITLKPNQTVFTIEFAALSYLAPDKNKYAYIMDGFDVNWNHVQNKRSATYTNLNPGTYFFKVKAANNDGVWNETPRVLKLVILPPWYKTRVAIISYIILLMTSIWGFIYLSQRRFRMRQALKNEQFKRDQETELNQQRLQFFTNISHEFRTPLTLIYSPIENIIKNYAHKLPHELKGQLSIIYKNAHRLNRLATELMDFRKLQFNKLNMKLVQQDIVAFTSSVTNLFIEEAKLNHIDLQLDIPEKQIFLWYDQHMIEKILFNLLSNAFKVTPEKGTIRVEIEVAAKHGKIELALGEKWIILKVIDTGAGLKEDQIAKIFERFYQADTHKTYYSSTGIGLSLAKGLIEKHHGDITVNSKPGIGSEFCVWFRTGKQHFSDSELEKASKEIIKTDLDPLPVFNIDNESIQSQNKNITVLVVEDNKELRSYLVGELNRYYRVIEAENGKVGIELAESRLPDMIVSDVLMPEIDGIELCKAIKTNIAISHIPIILLTARAAIEDQIEGTNAGADAYIIKPFNPELLKSRITQLLNSRKILFAKYSGNLNVLPNIDEYTSFDRDFLTKVTEYIIENISNADLSIEELSGKMNLSRSQLYRKIKSLSGHSATEFLRVIRLEQARKLITIKKVPINEACYQVGFGTPSYFSKCYKEHFGLLPSEE